MNRMPTISLKHAWSLNSVHRINKLFGNCCKNFIFETGLESTDYRFDFSVCILKDEIDSLLQYWGQNDFERTFTGNIHGNRDWENIYRFCQVWGDRDSILSKNIADLWFEFDNETLNDLLPNPCLFFSSLKLNHSTIKSNTGNISWLNDTALSTLYGDSLTGTIKENIKRCVDALPGKGAVFQIGAMLPRKSKSVRLCTSMRVNDYPSYLKGIGWTGSFDYLITLLEMLDHFADKVFVDIDVWEEISPKAAIECGYREHTNREQVGNGPNRLNRLLSYLIELNLCTVDKAERILEWMNEPLEELENGDHIKRSLSHLKVVLLPDNSIEAKAYLSLSIEDKNKNEQELMF